MSETASTSSIASRVDCGPEGCTIDWFASERLEVDDDPVAFTKLATDAGWGDGLPLIPPTEERVREHVAASGRFPAPRPGPATQPASKIHAGDVRHRHVYLAADGSHVVDHDHVGV